jgi:alkaline phosphatase/streptomycin-6-phosphatase
MATCEVYRKSNGGPGSIAEQMVDHKVDVLLGGGRARFAQLIDGGPHAGKSVIDSAVAQGYQYVSDAVGLAAVQSGQRVLGLFNDGNMSLEWGGELALPFPGSGPQSCIEQQRPANEPSLAVMTRKAIQLLDRSNSGKGGRGFFLQVEGASIDKQDHAANPCGQIGENIAFDAAVAVARAFARKNPDTLIVVTADHAHTSQIIDAVPATQTDHPGMFSVLRTFDGANMTVNYATAPQGGSQSHTGSQLRIAAQGPQAADVVGVTDQTDLYRTLLRALNLN